MSGRFLLSPLSIPSVGQDELARRITWGLRHLGSAQARRDAHVATRPYQGAVCAEHLPAVAQ
jgi:hypothetical protein